MQASHCHPLGNPDDASRPNDLVRATGARSRHRRVDACRRRVRLAREGATPARAGVHDRRRAWRRLLRPASGDLRPGGVAPGRRRSADVDAGAGFPALSVGGRADAQPPGRQATAAPPRDRHWARTLGGNRCRSRAGGAQRVRRREHRLAFRCRRHRRERGDGRAGARLRRWHQYGGYRARLRQFTAARPDDAGAGRLAPLAGAASTFFSSFRRMRWCSSSDSSPGFCFMWRRWGPRGRCRIRRRCHQCEGRFASLAWIGATLAYVIARATRD